VNGTQRLVYVKSDTCFKYKETVAKVYFFGAQQLSSNVGPLLCLGASMLHDGPGWSYLQHGLLLAVYAEVVKGHTL